MIGFVTTALFNWDLTRIVNFAAESGFDGIVLNAHRHSPLDTRTFDAKRRAALQELLAAHGCGITAVADMSLNLLHPHEPTRADMLAYAYTLIDLSAALGVGLVSMFAGRDPEKSVADNIPRFGEVFTPLADYAGEQGVRIAFENCPLFEGFPYRGRNIAYTPVAWDLMFEAAPAANLGLELDTAHPVWLQQDLAWLVKTYATRIFHVHLKDCHVDPVRLQAESIYGDGWWSYETPGDGDIDWPRFLGALQTIHYNGDLTFDLKGETRLTELARGLAYIRPLLVGQ